MAALPPTIMSIIPGKKNGGLGQKECTDPSVPLTFQVVFLLEFHLLNFQSYPWVSHGVKSKWVAEG